MSDTIPLGDVVEIKGGGTPSRTIKEYWGGSIPWATVKDFKTTTLNSTLETITRDGVLNSATNIVPAGAIIIPTRMAVGKAAISTIDLAINQDLKALLPNEKVDPRFLLHFLLSKSQFLEDRAEGATVKGIKLDLLRSLEFPNIDVVEQRRIAAILDKASAIRRKCDEAVRLADEVLKSAFLEMFFENANDWPRASLRTVAELINGDRSSNYPSGDDIVDSGVIFLNTKNIDESALVFENAVFITAEKFSTLSRGKLRRNDLVITLRGSVGQCAIFDCEYETGFINAQMMIIRPSASILPTYLHRLILHPIIQNKLEATKSGSAIPQLTSKQIGDLEVPLPPLDRQRDFTNLVAVVSRWQRDVKRKLHESERLFASLSQRAFRGEL